MIGTGARILVGGGRDYADRDRVFAVLDRYHETAGVACVIHGGATGADTLAGEWAEARGVAVEVYKAAWEAQGRAAGFIRNARMLRESFPHLIVAFPGGRGTDDMIARGHRAGVRVTVLPVTS